MCNFIEDKHISPGYICCGCRTYNGLQRAQCRACGGEHCFLEIPAGVKQCPSCGFAYEGSDGAALVGNVAGKKAEPGKCFCCGAKLPEVETVQ